MVDGVKFIKSGNRYVPERGKFIWENGKEYIATSGVLENGSNYMTATARYYNGINFQFKHEMSRIGFHMKDTETEKDFSIVSLEVTEKNSNKEILNLGKNDFSTSKGDFFYYVKPGIQYHVVAKWENASGNEKNIEFDIKDKKGKMVQKNHTYSVNLMGDFYKGDVTVEIETSNIELVYNNKTYRKEKNASENLSIKIPEGSDYTVRGSSKADKFRVQVKTNNSKHYKDIKIKNKFFDKTLKAGREDAQLYTGEGSNPETGCKYVSFRAGETYGYDINFYYDDSKESYERGVLPVFMELTEESRDKISELLNHEDFSCLFYMGLNSIWAVDWGMPIISWENEDRTERHNYYKYPESAYVTNERNVDVAIFKTTIPDLSHSDPILKVLKCYVYDDMAYQTSFTGGTFNVTFDYQAFSDGWDEADWLYRLEKKGFSADRLLLDFENYSHSGSEFFAGLVDFVISEDRYIYNDNHFDELVFKPYFSVKYMSETPLTESQRVAFKAALERKAKMIDEGTYRPIYPKRQ